MKFVRTKENDYYFFPNQLTHLNFINNNKINDFDLSDAGFIKIYEENNDEIVTFHEAKTLNMLAHDDVIKNEKLHKVTKDHTLVNLLVSTGELTPEQAKFHPRKNLLTRALGANDPIEIDIFDIDNTINGLFLCSDGLTNMVTDEQIEKVLNSKSSIEEQVEKLIKKSNIRGGTDNISIAYLKKESGDK